MCLVLGLRALRGHNFPAWVAKSCAPKSVQAVTTGIFLFSRALALSPHTQTAARVARVARIAHMLCQCRAAVREGTGKQQPPWPKMCLERLVELLA